MIELQGICREFHLGCTTVHALQGISLKVPPGGYASLMGPSGSGKSTLLNILGLLDRPTSGRYLLEGRDVTSLDDRDRTTLRRHTIGFVFQSFHLLPRLTALGNVELPMIFAGIPREQRRARARRALVSVGLEQRSSHRQSELSGGERQRVAIARAIVMEPALLLADEPTGNLDRASGSEIVSLLEGLNHHGLTLILVTHDPELGGRAPQRIRLSDGIIAAQQEKERLAGNSMAASAPQAPLGSPSTKAEPSSNGTPARRNR